MKTIVILISFVCLIVVLNLPVSAQPASDIELVGRLDIETTNDLGDVAYNDGYAYMCFNTGELKVFDYQEPSDPNLVGELRLWDDHIYSIQIGLLGNRAVVATNGKFWIIDVSDPTRVSLTGNQNVANFDIRVFGIDDQYIYTSNLRAVQIYQIVDDSSTELLSSYQIPGYATGLSSYGNKLAVSMWDGRSQGYQGTPGFELIDISNPRSPQRIAFHQGENCASIFLHENYCVAFDWYIFGSRRGTKEWVLYDIRNLQDISRTAQYSNEVLNPWLWGDHETLWMGGESNFNVIDVSNPASPEVAYGIALPAPIPSNYIASEILTLEGDRLIVRHGQIYSSSGIQLQSYYGMTMYDVSDHRDVQILSRYSRYGDATSMIRNDNQVYIGMDNWVCIADISDAPHPREVGKIPVPGAKDLFIDNNNILYVGLKQGGIVSFDISHFESIMELGRIGGFAQPEGIIGGTRYIFHPPFVYEMRSNQPEFYRIISIENPEDMVEVGRFDLELRFPDAVIEGDRMYAINGQDLIAIDLEEPTAPQMLGYMTWTQPFYEITGLQGHIFTMPNRSWLLEFDVTDPQNIHKIDGRGVPTRTPIDGIGRASMMEATINDSGDFLAIADGSAGVRLFYNDWNSRPVEVGYYDPPGNMIDVEFGPSQDNSHLICSLNETSLFVLEASEALSSPADLAIPATLSLSCAPNPFNSMLTIRYVGGLETAATRLTIHDINGREVFSAVNPPRSAANNAGNSAATRGGAAVENVLSWDATTVPAGIYLVRLQAGTEVVTRKVVLVR